VSPDAQSWPKRIGALTLFADDLPTTKAFYAAVFGVPMIFEDDDSAVFNFGNTLVNLLRTSAAGELVEPAAVGGPGSAPRCLITVDVDDVDAVCAELTKRGVALLNGPMDRPWGVRTAAFQDPAGHAWEVANAHTA